MTVDWSAAWVTFRLAFWTTAILLVLGVPLAWWLVQARFRGKSVIEGLIALPLVLPPTVLGFYILSALGPNSVLGRQYQMIVGSPLPFTFAGILFGSVLFNLPFACRPFMAAFEGVDRRLIEASWCLGVSRIGTFVRVVLPLSWPGVLAGMVLTFAHTVGEFGVVLMLGGNIPGQTRTLSIAVYDQVQALDYEAAARTSLVLVLISFTALWAASRLQRRAVSA